MNTPARFFCALALTTILVVPARASNTTIAAAGAAGVVLGPLGLQAVAGSRLDVTVEVYRDTLTWTGNDRQGQPEYRFGGKPFRLSGPLAMKTQLGQLATTAGSPTATEVARRVNLIRELLGAQEILVADLRRTREGLAADFAAHEPGGRAAALLKEIDDVLARNAQLKAVFTSLQDTVAAALGDGEFSTAELAKAADQLAALSLIAAGIPRDFSPNLGGFLRTQLQVAFNAVLVDAPEATGVEIAKLGTFDTLAMLPEVDTTAGQVDGVEAMLWAIADKLRALKHDGWHFVRDGKACTADEAAIVQAVGKVLQAVGYKVDDLKSQLAITKRDDFSVRWGAAPNGIQRVAGVPVQISDLRFAGVSVSANFGPIINEVIQGILSENDLIDRVTTGESRWVRYNYAYSRGDAGNHNAIVYFDNMLTPVLKSASYDPSIFLAANAQIYKRATLVLSHVVGTPLAKDSAEDKDGVESLNLLDLKARKHKAVRGTGAERERMLAVLKLVLDEHTTLADKHITPAVPAKENPAEPAKPAAWKDEAKAKAHLLELVQFLGAAGTRLEQH